MGGRGVGTGLGARFCLQGVSGAAEFNPALANESGDFTLGRLTHASAISARSPDVCSRLPIVVDLDGTLTPADSLHELLAALCVKRPLLVLLSLLRARSKAQVKAAWLGLQPDFQPLLPWNDEVVKLLRAEEGRPIILCTATPQSLAERVVQPLGIFSEVIGSSAEQNLRGSAKAAHLVQRFGRRGFVYIGNDSSDLAVWAEAAEGIVVSHDAQLAQRAREICPNVQVLAPAVRSGGWGWVKLLRPHQWSKNLLVFAPLIAAHRMAEQPLLIASTAAFGVFCALSSGVYLLNDGADREADRLHPTKRFRPVAAGAISPLWAWGVGAAALVVALGLAAGLGGKFFLVSATYVAVAVAYSFWLKRVAYLDVAVLAALYTSRLMAGASVTGITPSGWLAGFSLCIFLSLALCKRYTEIAQHLADAAADGSRRSYNRSYGPGVWAAGIFSMSAACLILAGYINSPAVVLLYEYPARLWAAVACMAFWGGRVW